MHQHAFEVAVVSSHCLDNAACGVADGVVTDAVVTGSYISCKGVSTC